MNFSVWRAPVCVKLIINSKITVCKNLYLITVLSFFFPWQFDNYLGDSEDEEENVDATGVYFSKKHHLKTCHFTQSQFRLARLQWPRCTFGVFIFVFTLFFFLCKAHRCEFLPFFHISQQLQMELDPSQIHIIFT